MCGIWWRIWLISLRFAAREKLFLGEPSDRNPRSCVFSPVLDTRGATHCGGGSSPGSKLIGKLQLTITHIVLLLAVDSPV